MYMAPLYNLITAKEFRLEPNHEEAIKQLKEALITAPALALPNYKKPFLLFCHENDGHATGVLCQKHGNKERPLGYYSCQLDSVIKGSPSCVRAVAAWALLLEKVADVVLNHELLLLVPHWVTEILNRVQTKHLSAARLTKYEVALLTPSNLKIERCNVLNPTTIIPHISHTEVVENEHDCLELIQSETEGLNNVTDVPLQNPDLEMYVDMSRYFTEDGKSHTGYAVVTSDDVLVKKKSAF